MYTTSKEGILQLQRLQGVPGKHIYIYIYISTDMTDDCPVKLRQKVDRPSQGKVIGDSFPTD